MPAVSFPHHYLYIFTHCHKVVVGCGLVSVNYLLGIVIVVHDAMEWTLPMYFAVAMVVWAWACAVGVSLWRRLANEGWAGGGDDHATDSEQLLGGTSTWEDPRDRP